MAGGVDDVDVVAVPVDGGVLRQNGDAALFFLVVGVHHALAFRFFAVEGAGQLQEFVYQGGLAMVDVGDDGDVTEIFDHVCISISGFGVPRSPGRAYE
ncbi:hypothetical protein D3C84_711670 [compost metagenome]